MSLFIGLWNASPETFLTSIATLVVISRLESLEVHSAVLGRSS